jgi:hypothetical protein
VLALRARARDDDAEIRLAVVELSTRAQHAATATGIGTIGSKLSVTLIEALLAERSLPPGLAA